VVADPDLDDDTRRDTDSVDRLHRRRPDLGSLPFSVGERPRCRALGTYHARWRASFGAPPPENGLGYLNEIQPILFVWSSRHDHLREVTCNDILGAVELLHGSKRRHTVSVLRSLFRHCKKRGSIFADPAARIPVGQQTNGVILPLQADDVQRSLRAAAKPVNRLVLALAAVHAARPKAILQMHVDDVDLGNRRLVVAGRVRPLDDLTRKVLLEWLDYRRTRWPNTANLHLIINQQTAAETGPVSKVWATEAFRGLTATLERLRVDRQLEEALTRGPDPLHLASVFGLDEKTAIRYANAARQLLESSAESKAGWATRTATWKQRSPRLHQFTGNPRVHPRL